MAYLLDTGILLRLVNKSDPAHQAIDAAVQTLVTRGESVTTTVQNIAEFFNAATRRKQDNGFGLSAQDALVAIRSNIVPICLVLHENRRLFAELQRLLAAYSVEGKQVHDARLVAAMLTWRISHILTLNERHFLRYLPEGITVESP